MPIFFEFSDWRKSLKFMALIKTSWNLNFLFDKAVIHKSIKAFVCIFIQGGASKLSSGFAAARPAAKRIV